MATERKPRNVKTTISLPPDAAEALRALAEERNTTLAEVIRRAISVDKYLGDAKKAGSRLLLEDADKTIKEIIIF
jgi:predicted transcriptional regulator